MEYSCCNFIKKTSIEDYILTSSKYALSKTHGHCFYSTTQLPEGLFPHNASVERPRLPAVNDEWASYRCVEAVHLTAESQERVRVLRRASVRPTREVQLTNTSHLSRLL